LALDLGEVRTGVAISDHLRMLASPLEVVASERLAEYLEYLVKRESVREVVVGLPRNLSGEEGFQARRARQQVAELKQSLPDVEFIERDERLTTRMAGGGRNERSDHRAAALLLQEYLDASGGKE
jgi:putative Holliday junction resolvase